ncbi:MAG: glycerophosphodiester phosphodiesterase [Cryobacterium sp.]|uniref:glycerophosphodiester phosphodiesterase family protein n=1 Tax=unclassified Cryobacterium TaxID=2649013 RepID=UPI001A1D24BB|nr:MULTISPECIES: glycerophosphodiester phosphodiesterase family protein [unclassified Cryobacterium]MCY7404366.1 glycerophosphodiester phosphodiesterase [Cryobacterium sp.]MEC5154659.1 glycerophosphoryl diester phosphodiesterase [Cryobacterium sp. CAN_C3]
MAESAQSLFLTAPYPRILAHRGLAQEAPENTLLAFVKALAGGATHLETDVHVSRDGVAVISHDRDLTGLGQDVRIDQLTLTELKRINLGYGQSLTSLAEALEAFPSARFNIDIKTDAAAEPTARAIRDQRATARVLVTSFNEPRRRRVVGLLPGVVSSASSLLVARAVAATNLGLTAAVRRALQGCVAVQVPQRAGPVRIVTPRFIDMMHRVDVEVHVWTINDPVDMIRLLDLGVDGLVTDRTDLAVIASTRRT